MKRTNHRVRSGNVALHAVTEGNPANAPLVLVHGYPDNHHVWDGVVDELTRDFYVVRYDVRGAGLSDKPARTREYRLGALAGDLKAVVDQLLPGRAFHLAAHDWGSIQSWESVTAGPLRGRILSYSSISGPCLDHVGYWLREQATDLQGGGTGKVLRQLASSWYVFLFQVPVVSETLWRLGLDRAWPGILRKYEGIADARFSELQQDDGRYGVKLYRANFLPRLLRPEPRHAKCPVQLIIPKGDNYVGEQLFDRQVRWTGKLTRREVDAPHWAPLTAPGVVADAIREFAFADRRAG
ncbi:MAG: alpha/beta fold hydrolase [Marinobacter sp.]|nr:alpha/beta fold hydrolase [Marinobacter sp.]